MIPGTGVGSRETFGCRCSVAAVLLAGLGARAYLAAETVVTIEAGWGIMGRSMMPLVMQRLVVVVLVQLLVVVIVLVGFVVAGRRFVVAAVGTFAVT